MIDGKAILRFIKIIKIMMLTIAIFYM